jgi:hypothetical protein
MLTQIKAFFYKIIQFLKSLFTTDNSTSSKRFLAFLFSAVVIFLAFFHYGIEVINSFLIFIASLMGLTTVEKFKNDSKI